jgi:hypothetical protein
MRDFILGVIASVVLGGGVGAFFGYKELKRRFDAIDDELCELAGAIADFDIEIDYEGGGGPDGGIPLPEEDDADEANDNKSDKVVGLKPRKAS